MRDFGIFGDVFSEGIMGLWFLSLSFPHFLSLPGSHKVNSLAPPCVSCHGAWEQRGQLIMD
jgi:hypothetical protein